MSADAMARLREELRVMGDHGMRYCEQVRTDDLRVVFDRAALLDEAECLTGDLTPETLTRLSDVQGYVRCGDRTNLKVDYERGIAEGERRERARIVASLEALHGEALRLPLSQEYVDGIECACEHTKEDVNYLECPWCGDPVKSLPSNEDGEWEDGTLGTCECGRRLRVWADETAHLLDLDEEGA